MSLGESERFCIPVASQATSSRTNASSRCRVSDVTPTIRGSLSGSSSAAKAEALALPKTLQQSVNPPRLQPT